MTLRVLTALAGIWLITAPDVLGYGGAARVNDRIVGPLIAAAAIVAISEAMRPVRWAGVPLGAWLILAPWVLHYPEASASISSLLAGSAVVALSLIRGAVHGRFGGGWSSLWHVGPPAYGPTENRSTKAGGR